MAATELAVFFSLILATWNSATATPDCKRSNESLPKLLKLPGDGWDALTGTVKSGIFEFGYTTCLTTPDGQYLVPDGMQIRAVKDNSIQLFADVFEDVNDFTPETARSFYTGAGTFRKNLLGGQASIEGTFAEEFLRVKRRLAVQNATLTRVQLHGTVYRLKLNSAIPLRSRFVELLKQANGYYSRSKPNVGQYFLETLVKEFGTHYSTAVDVGAMLVEDNEVERSYILSRDRNVVSAAASVEFLKMLQYRYEDILDTVSSSELQNYKSKRIFTQVKAHGALFLANETVEEWLTRIRSDRNAKQVREQDLAIIDRRGEPLYNLVNPNIVEGLASEELMNLQNELRSVIETYYMYNTHKGCTNYSSSSYDFTANVDDGSCAEKVVSGEKFNGFYQSCKFNESKELIPNPCTDFETTNTATGEFSCKKGDTKIVLLNYTNTRRPVCDKKGNCSSRGYTYIQTVVCITVLNNNNQAPSESSSSNDLVIQYGGTYSPVSVNPFTGSRSCPRNFHPKTLGYDVQVCLSTTPRRLSVPLYNFGGFFSCDSIDFEWLPVDSCQAGFSQHLLTFINGCFIKQCFNSSSFVGRVQFPLIAPTVTDPKTVFLEDHNEDNSEKKSKGGSTPWMGLAIAFFAAFVLALIVIVVGLVLRKRSRENPQNSGYSRIGTNDQQPILESEKPTTYQSLPSGPGSSEEPA